MADKPNSKSTRRFARTPVNTDKSSQANAVAAQNEAPAIRKAETKINKVLTLLNREEGATLAEIVSATGWQAHTSRAAITGLKKKGHSVTSVITDGARNYRIPRAQQGESEASNSSESTPDA